MNRDQLALAISAYTAAIRLHGGSPTPSARRAGIDAAIQALLVAEVTA
jgi:hypothetical protein